MADLGAPARGGGRLTVIDASALPAFMFRGLGHEIVVDALDDGSISAVSLSEVIGRFVHDGHDAGVVLEPIQSTAIEIVPFRPADAAVAASLVPGTQPHGLSLADRACLALALTRGVPAMTADRVWADLDVGVAGAGHPAAIGLAPPRPDDRPVQRKTGAIRREPRRAWSAADSADTQCEPAGDPIHTGATDTSPSRPTAIPTACPSPRPPRSAWSMRA